jgi:hypothetical protein
MTRTSRSRRATLKARARQTRAAARIARRGTGLNPRDARSMVGTLRKVAAKLGVVGTAGRIHRGQRMRDCSRFTPAQVAVICLSYKPRKPAYRIVAARLALAA